MKQSEGDSSPWAVGQSAANAGLQETVLGQAEAPYSGFAHRRDTAAFSCFLLTTWTPSAALLSSHAGQLSKVSMGLHFSPSCSRNPHCKLAKAYFAVRLNPGGGVRVALSQLHRSWVVGKPQR